MAAAAVAPAAADSLTFIKNNNIWLANPDGSGQYQVTFDGTAASPYEYPSQSDAGTIVAIRRTAGQRPRIYRMSQSGRLLNAPINTPAPGTGAMDAKVSPNGALVAYWFETLVNDQLCSFCVSIANRALLSYSDRFTHHEAIGTPNTGGWPSWIGNNTIVVANGSAELWYYRLGTAAADEWFNDGVFIGAGAGLQTLLDAEVAPAGDRLAVVRGNHQETIRFLELNGPPPAAPTPIAGCWFDQPSGRIFNPTWTSDGESDRLAGGRRRLARQPGRPQLPTARARAGHPRRRRARPQPRCDQPRTAPIVRPARQPDDLPPRGDRLRRMRTGRADARSRRPPRLAHRLRQERHARARPPQGQRGAAQAHDQHHVPRARRRHARRPPHHHWHLRPSRDRARRRPARLHGRRQREAHDQADRPGQETPPEGAPREGHPQGQLHAEWRKGDLDSTPGPAQAMSRPNESPTLTFRHASARRPGRRSSMKPRCEQTSKQRPRIAGEALRALLIVRRRRPGRLGPRRACGGR